MGPRRLVVTMASASARSSGSRKQLFGAHDAGVVDKHVERGELDRDLSSPANDRMASGHLQCRASGTSYRGLRRWFRRERPLAAAGNNDPGCQRHAQGLSKAAADARPAAGNENRVAGGFHGVNFS